LGGLVAVAVLIGASSCGADVGGLDEATGNGQGAATLSPIELEPGAALRVVATTSIVADVVRNVGGDQVAVVTLLPVGADPHAFDPTPQDVASISNAHVVFANGAGLEAFLDPLLTTAGTGAPVVRVSAGVDLLQLGEGHEDEEELETDHAGSDPHVWFDPHNVIVWVDNIAGTLTALDPSDEVVYASNAEAYKADLRTLDEWIQTQVALIAPEDRLLVTDHASFGYFARRYGFQQIGAVFPGYSSMAEPSARDLARLETAIREQDVKAVFVGLTVNPDLARRVADDTGTQLVFVYTGSLSDSGGPAADYVAFMRFNVGAFVTALR
jgi:ABC-type Zn uptake system ZnuABC Zn-binding protein ZnuA